jgi:pimeloyl-ACP methyl ester carboxylesterase
MTRRETVDVGGVPISYLTAGKGGSLVLLLHGTYWSRVWQPVLDGIAAAGLRPVAVDFPGFGRSGGELTLSEASVPRLSAWSLRFLEALGHKGPVMVAGHDIGGGVAQHLALAGTVEVPRVAVVNGIMYDSWPVPGVARFRDPAVAAATTRDDVLAARRVSVVKALGRPASEAEIAEYLDPWTDPRVARSWLALAGAADHRYTMRCRRLFCSQRRQSFWCGARTTHFRQSTMPNAMRARFRTRGSSGSSRQDTFRWKTTPKP